MEGTTSFSLINKCYFHHTKYVQSFTIQFHIYLKFQIIVDFIDYLVNWEKIAKENNQDFLPQTTYLGFLVSLKATLELTEFLVKHCDFSYLMTARLNQDSLEVSILISKFTNHNVIFRN